MDKKRAIIYFLPRDQFFKVDLVFGQKTIDTIMSGGTTQDIKDELEQARKHAEGRGILLEVREESIIEAIQLLVLIKFVY